MKNTEVAMIILVASISVVVSYFLGNVILGDPSERVETLSYMNMIDEGIQEPDIETFNPYALNPTVEVYVGNCGPLEEWNEAKYLCVPKDGLNVGEDDESESADGDKTPVGASTSENSDSLSAGDE